MNKAFLSLSVILLIGLSLKSQDRFRAGLNFGLQTSQINGDGYYGYDKVGPILGAVLQTPINKRGSIQFGLNYVQKGSRDPQNPKIGKFNYTLIRLHYIEVPVLYQLKYKKFIFEVGPTLGTLFKWRQRDATGDILPVIYNMRRFELGYTMGLAYKLFGQYFVNVRWGASLSPIAEENKYDNIRLQFIGGAYNLGFSFMIKKYLGRSDAE